MRNLHWRQLVLYPSLYTPTRDDRAGSYTSQVYMGLQRQIGLRGHLGAEGILHGDLQHLVPGYEDVARSTGDVGASRWGFLDPETGARAAPTRRGG